MRLVPRRWIAAPLLTVALGLAPAALAQEKPAAAAAAGWAASTTPQGVVEVKLDPKQTDAVNKVSAYFNALKQMSGVFVQTDPEKKRSRGRFALLQPGKFRFDFASPSKKIMASDGKLLRIKEPDQSNEDAVELDNTVFRLLLKKDVDLIRDARILEVQEAEDLILIGLQDRAPDAPGKVQLIFVKKPALDLKEWVVRDAQGLETKVEIGEINKTAPVDPKMFVWEGAGNVFKN